MINLAHSRRETLQAPAFGATSDATALYRQLAHDGECEPSALRDFLEHQLARARTLPNDLPANDDALEAWIERRSAKVGEDYAQYLAGRKAGLQRRYFTNKSHALYFLRAVAPTKLVDGAWLYGTLARWEDPDFHPLIQTYLEELGDGTADKNHVVLYKKLLAQHAVDNLDGLDDEHFTQGAIQLCLAHDASRYLPELVGFNLGYEQLPLHLLITAYELNELGIDPYYFTLHVTVDNASTGHAQKAVQALRQVMARSGDQAYFYKRVKDGYALNELGAGTTALIAGFDLEEELFAIFTEKSRVGKNMHSDYCKIAGRSINDWLSESSKVPEMLAALQTAGWIQRGEPAESSRFWGLLQGERAEMFGVFSSYEQQVLRDWIEQPPDGQLSQKRALGFRAQQRALKAHGADVTSDSKNGPAAFDAGAYLLERQMLHTADRGATMRELIRLMSPQLHHTTKGLMATRLFGRIYGRN